MLLYFRVLSHSPPKKDESFDKDVKIFKNEVTTATGEVDIRKLERGGRIDQEAYRSGFGDGVEVVGVGNSSGRRGDESEQDPWQSGKTENPILITSPSTELSEERCGRGGFIWNPKPKQSLWKDIMISRDGRLVCWKVERMAGIGQKVGLSWECQIVVMEGRMAP